MTKASHRALMDAFAAAAALAAAAMVVSSCGSSANAPLNSSVFSAGGSRSLYVVSGSCYAGGATTSAGPANAISKYDVSTGQFLQTVIDYNQLAPGDSPVALADYDASRFLVLVENTAGRRLDLVNKDGSGSSVYLVNATALNGVSRSIEVLSDLSVLVSKSTAIEKFSSAKARIPAAAPFVNAPAAPCANSTTLISSTAVHSSGMVVYTHAAATPNNLIGVIKSTGYTVAADCLAGQPAPTTTALPTRAAFHSASGKLLVAFGSATQASNFVYSYNFNGATGAISGAAVAFSDSTVVNGPSAMAEDRATGDVFVANAVSTFNNIERFRVSSGSFTRVGSAPFIPSTILTRCVADMEVMN